MKREELIKSKGYNIAKIQTELFRQLNSYLEKNKITQTKFAEELGVTKGYVSQILNGNFDFKISKLVELTLAIGMVPNIEFTHFSEVDKKKKAGKTIYMSLVYRKDLEKDLKANIENDSRRVDYSASQNNFA